MSLAEKLFGSFSDRELKKINPLMLLPSAVRLLGVCWA